MEDKALAIIVIEGEKKARLSGAALLELRRRFDNLKGKQTIIGYRKGQWIRFCNEFLKLSDRQARRLIDLTGEASPGDKHDGSANRILKDADGNRITKDGKPFPPPPWTAKTPDGTPVDVARSAAQKAVRDGDEQAGIYWIKQLYFAERKVWKALSIFAVEEIGIADLSVKTHVLELEKLAEACKDERNSDLLHVITAMTICCRAKKCRAADDAAIWYNEHHFYDAYAAGSRTSRQDRPADACHPGQSLRPPHDEGTQDGTGDGKLQAGSLAVEEQIQRHSVRAANILAMSPLRRHWKTGGVSKSACIDCGTGSHATWLA